METNEVTNEIARTVENVVDNDIPNNPMVELATPDLDSEIIADMNEAFAMKQRLYEKVLAPQLSKNEELKRDHKNRLMDNIFKILKWQFIATYIFVIIAIFVVGYSSIFSSKSEKLVLELISFVKFYITAIIAELISILFFIVQNVFDTSIVDLFKNFDKKDSSK